MKQQYRWMLPAALSLLWTAFIFSNSLQGSDDSNGATYSLLELLAPLLQTLEALFGKADWFFILRKAAHMLEFCALGVLTKILADVLKSRFDRPFTAHCVCYCMAVAVADEFLQGFSDRSSEVGDVLIDCTGAVIGIVGAACVTWLFKKISKRRKEREIHDGNSNGLQ